MSDVRAPSLWEVMAADPSIPIEPATLRLVIRDQRRRSRARRNPAERPTTPTGTLPGRVMAVLRHHR